MTDLHTMIRHGWPGLLLLLLVATGCAHGFEKATQALDEGDHKQAESIAADELNEDPNSPWGNLLMAEALVQRDEHQEARSYARRADESEEFPLRAARVRGEIYAVLGRPVDAADAYQRARNIDPDAVDDESFVDVLEAGLSYARARSAHGDIWRLTQWLAEVDPDHREADPSEIAVRRRAQAVELRRQGEYFEAAELLEDALADEAEHLSGEALDLGEIYARLDMAQEATRAWGIYLDVAADEEELIQRHLDVANLASRHDMHGAAARTLEELPAQIDDPYRRAEILLELARHQIRAEQGAEGRRTVYDYVDLLSADAPEGEANYIPYHNATELAFELNQTRLAINLLERAIHEAEPSRVVTQALADIYARRAQLDSVEETLDLYISRVDDPVEATLFAGQWASERNNHDLARRYFEAATELDGAPARAWYSLAESLAELEDYDAMSRTVHAYVDLRQESDAALSEAAELFFEHRLYEESERYFERLQQRRPDDRHMALQFADLYQQWSRPSDAAQVWNDWLSARGDQPSDIEWVARISRRAGDLGRASEYYLRAAEAGSHEAWLEAADIYLRQDRTAAMARALESYLDAHPDKARGLERAATRYRRAGMDARHVDTLIALVELKPESWQFHERLATLLLDQGRSTEAFDHLRRFVERSDDPVEALDQISSPIASSHPPSWLLDFYRLWEDDDSLGPDIDRLLGDAYSSLSVAHATSEATAEYAHRRAREHYLAYLEATEGEQKDWRRLANQWRQNNMWRPAAIAFERHSEMRGRSQLYSLSYAETLLRLGEADRASELLERYFQNEQRRPAAANRIANLLRDFRLYDEAEDYAAQLFLSGDDASISEGFHLLAEIYQERENLGRLEDLVTEYMNRATNTTRARRAVIQVLSSAGQWELAAAQLGEFELSSISQFAVDIGFHHYRSGAPDRAFMAFEEAAHQSHRPELAWQEAAEFLEARGEWEMAGDAYNRAVQANPDDLTVRTARGAFLIRRGDIDAGWRDYEFGRNSSSTFRPSRRAAFFNALTDVGDFEQAERVNAHITEDGLTSPGEIQKTVGTWQLRSADPSTVNAALDPIRAGTWGLHETLTYFDAAGHHDITARLIEEEFDEGDPTTAGVLLLNRSMPISRLVGWDQQRKWLRAVVDPLARSDTRLIGPVGDHRARSGELDEARLYLQAAVDHRDDVYQPQLAHTLLLLGDHDEALQRFESSFLDVEASPESLEATLLRFELAGDAEGARRFLARLADEPSLVDFVLPYKIHYELEHHGNPDRAIDDVLSTLRAMDKLPSTAFREGAASRTTEGLSREDVISTALIRSLETIAALGHIEVVEEVLDGDLPAARDHQLDRLRFKIALAGEDIATADAMADDIVAATDGARERQQTRLDLARKFIAFGVQDGAQRFVDDAMADQSDFRNHAPFSLHLALQVLADQRDLSKSIDDYLDRVPNRHHARMTLIDDLRRLGRDAEALRLAREAADLRPTGDVLRHALIAALDDGDNEAAAEFTGRLFAVADEPIDEISNVMAGRARGSEPELMLPVIEAIREVRPDDLRWKLEQARILFSDGQIGEARMLISDALEERSYQRDIIAEVVDLLADEHLDVELAKLVAPKVPDDVLWPGLIITFAEANLALGLNAEADEWLARLDTMSERSAQWRLELAERLVRRHLYDAVTIAVEDLDDADELGPYLDYLKGLTYLATTDDKEVGLDLIRGANTDGVGRFRTHYNGIQAALHGGQRGAAVELMDDLARLPVRDNDIASLPLQTLLSAAMHQPDGPDAIREFLEERRPRLVDGYGATWTQFAGQLAGAFERTDDPEGAYGFYRDRIWQSLLLRDEAELPIYLNNLAYTYSTTDRHVDRGLDKVLRAIVLRQDRSASFLDTLGWIFYRQGDRDRAEDEIRRALRTYERGPSGLHELYSHLQILLEERFDYDRAVWLDVNRKRLPPEGFGW